MYPRKKLPWGTLPQVSYNFRTIWVWAQPNRPYRLFTFDPMASFPCLPVLARQACAWRLHLMFPARICCFLILSPITNLSLNVLCTKHEDWCHTKTRLLGQKWINGKVYWEMSLGEQSVLIKVSLGQVGRGIKLNPLIVVMLSKDN